MKTLKALKSWTEANIKASISGFEYCEINNIKDYLTIIFKAENDFNLIIPVKIHFGEVQTGAWSDYDSLSKTIHLPKRDQNIESKLINSNKNFRMINNTSVPYYAVPSKSGIFFHELAHALDHSALYDYRRAIDNLPLQTKSIFKNLSGMAFDGLFKDDSIDRAAETFAESFSTYINNSDRKKFIPQEIVILIENILKRGYN